MANLTKCHSFKDCQGNELCGSSGYCQCDFLYGYTGPPECVTYSIDAIYGFIFTLISLLAAVITVLLTIATLWSVVTNRRRGFLLSCPVLCCCAAFAGVFSHLQDLANIVTYGSWVEHGQEYRAASNLLNFVHGTFSVVAFFNLVLMWLEFIIAARRADRIGSNLQFTARVLYVYISLWLFTGVILILLSRLVDQFFFSIWGLSTVFSGCVLVVLYAIGGRLMRNVFHRAAERFSNDAAASASVSPTASAALIAKSQRMDYRARITKRTSSYGVVFGVLYIFMSSVWPVAAQLELHLAVVWTAICTARLAIYAAICNMSVWVLLCVRVDRQALSDDMKDAETAHASRRSSVEPAATCQAQIESQVTSFASEQLRQASVCADTCLVGAAAAPSHSCIVPVRASQQGIPASTNRAASEGALVPRRTLTGGNLPDWAYEA